MRRLNIVALQPETDDDVVTANKAAAALRQVAARVEALEIALGAVLPTGQAS